MMMMLNTSAHTHIKYTPTRKKYYIVFIVTDTLSVTHARAHIYLSLDSKMTHKHMRAEMQRWTHNTVAVLIVLVC